MSGGTFGDILKSYGYSSWEEQEELLQTEMKHANTHAAELGEAMVTPMMKAGSDISQGLTLIHVLFTSTILASKMLAVCSLRSDDPEDLIDTTIEVLRAMAKNDVKSLKKHIADAMK